MPYLEHRVLHRADRVLSEPRGRTSRQIPSCLSPKDRIGRTGAVARRTPLARADRDLLEAHGTAAAGAGRRRPAVCTDRSEHRCDHRRRVRPSRSESFEVCRSMPRRSSEPQAAGLVAADARTAALRDPGETAAGTRFHGHGTVAGLACLAACAIMELCRACTAARQFGSGQWRN